MQFFTLIPNLRLSVCRKLCERRTNYVYYRTANDWWDWAHSNLVNELRAQSYYNGRPPFGLK